MTKRQQLRAYRKMLKASEREYFIAYSPSGLCSLSDGIAKTTREREQLKGAISFLECLRTTPRGSAYFWPPYDWETRRLILRAVIARLKSELRPWWKKLLNIK